MRRFASVFGRSHSRPKVDTSHTIATDNKGSAGLSPTGPTVSEIENIQVASDEILNSPLNQTQKGQAAGNTSASTPAPRTEDPQTKTELSKKRYILFLGRSKTRRAKLKEAKKDKQLSAPLPPPTEETKQAPEPASNGVVSEPVPEPTTVQQSQGSDTQVVLRSQQDQEPEPEPEPSNDSHPINRGEDNKNNNNNDDNGVQNERPGASATSPPRTSKPVEEHGGNVASGNTDQQVARANENNHDNNSTTQDQQSTQSVLLKQDISSNNDNNNGNYTENTGLSKSPKRMPTKSEIKKPLMRFLSKRHNGRRPDRKDDIPSQTVVTAPPPLVSKSSSPPALSNVPENTEHNPLSPTIEGRQWNDSDNNSLFCY